MIKEPEFFSPPIRRCELCDDYPPTDSWLERVIIPETQEYKEVCKLCLNLIKKIKKGGVK